MTTTPASPPQDTDAAALLLRIGAGSPAAFAELYDQLAPVVYGVTTRALADPVLAERATESAFLNIWQRAAHYDATRQDAAAWILAITHRAVARQRRLGRVPAPVAGPR